MRRQESKQPESKWRPVPSRPGPEPVLKQQQQALVLPTKQTGVPRQLRRRLKVRWRAVGRDL